MLPNGLDYVVAVYACLLAGVVAVPFYPPSVLTARTARVFGERLQEIHRDCAPDVVVLAEDQAGFVAEVLAPAYRDGSGPVLITAGELPAAVDPAGVAVRAGGADLAVLQYTSGSTRTPSGVMLSHDNLVANVRALAAKTAAAEGEATPDRSSSILTGWHRARWGRSARSGAPDRGWRAVPGASRSARPRRFAPGRRTTGDGSSAPAISASRSTVRRTWSAGSRT